MQSILSLLNTQIRFVEKPCIQKPFWIVELPSEDCLRRIASRSVLIKNCIELWSRARSKTQLHKNLQNSLQNTSEAWIVQDSIDGTSNLHLCPKSLIETCSSKSFKVHVETFCKHFTSREKIEKIEVINYLCMIFYWPFKIIYFTLLFKQLA